MFNNGPLALGKDQIAGCVLIQAVDDPCGTYMYLVQLIKERFAAGTPYNQPIGN